MIPQHGSMATFPADSLQSKRDTPGPEQSPWSFQWNPVQAPTELSDYISQGRTGGPGPRGPLGIPKDTGSAIWVAARVQRKPLTTY